METTRIWSPTAPSLLWAHEIRRENIHLVNQLDLTRTELSTTTSATTTLQQSVTDLQHQIQNLDTGMRDLESKLGQIEGSMNERIEALSELVQTSRDENGEVRMKLEDLECGVKEEGGVRASLMKGVLEGVMDMRRELGREMKLLRWKAGIVEADDESKQDEIDLVPDSIPTGSTSFMQQRHSQSDQQEQLQHLTQTTFGEPSEVDSQPVDHEADDTKRQKTEEIDIHQAMKQNKMALTEYLSYADNLRMQLTPRRREGVIVEAFVGGLDDTQIRALLEKQMDEAGWTWSVLTMLVRDMAREEMRVDAGRIGNGRATTVDIGTKERKRRRFIPIVPADEDDSM